MKTRIFKLIFFAILVLPFVVNAQQNLAVKDSNKAYKAFNKGKYTDAIALYQNAFDDLTDIQGPEAKSMKARIVFNMAECYRKMDVPKKEVELYNMAIKMGYTDASASTHLAEANQEISKFNTTQRFYSVSPTPTPVFSAPDSVHKKSGVRLISQDSINKK